MDCSRQMNGVENSDGNYSHKTYSGTELTVSDSALSHPIPPPCPHTWSPLSPPAYKLISPQVPAFRHHFVANETAHLHFGGCSKRHLLSAVPMGMYSGHPHGTPIGTSPPQHQGYLTGMVQASHQHGIAGSLRGSPGSMLQAQTSIQTKPYASPAQSDASSRLGVQTSPRVNSGLPSTRHSPRAVDCILASQRIVTSQMSDHVQGACMVSSKCTKRKPSRVGAADE
jgi:hypothetical protein